MPTASLGGTGDSSRAPIGSVNHGRRNFLKKTATAGAVATLTPVATVVDPFLHSANADEKFPLNPDVRGLSYEPKSTSFESSIQKIIDNATKAGALKDEKDFTKITSKDDKTRDLIFETDNDAYRNYVEGLKARARVFEDPNSFGSLIAMVHKFKGKFGNTPRLYSDETGDKLLDHTDYRQSINAVGKLNYNYNLRKFKVDQLRGFVPHIMREETGISVPLYNGDTSDDVAMRK